MERADLLLALACNKPVSAGIQFELGYAQALHKRILILTQSEDKPIPYINLGLAQQPNVNTLGYGSLEAVPQLLKDVL